jgi:hypothetical protein
MVTGTMESTPEKERNEELPGNSLVDIMASLRELREGQKIVAQQSRTFVGEECSFLHPSGR